MSKFLKVVLGLGGVAAAVLLSRKENRDRLKEEYNKYKEDPEDYKQNAKEVAESYKENAKEAAQNYKEKASSVASDLQEKAGDTIEEVKKDPKAYAKKVKEDPKGFLNEQKERFINGEEKKEDHVEEARFADEGAVDPSNNLRVVSEEDLKNNQNQPKQDKNK
ncbi:YtxH domain-containing protein [Staphylococcus pettenkoferi]|uniref:YtxH domain-containing protein n=1 Tax=Staphylococcus pettenkoferi TaxID=170573 RepID=A0ABT4BJM2_9STAP|nr:YtxH domain-containing protein [Staphylococcus pettenkoferi]MCY1563743.1 YtxH domain-containing protein [Staphylococcus pettenkoferi]MCY1570793.1 YtxH domain-containing protein [Staphylococcus pettenkoferi]MCY1581967.1 YtxH domain-containing protein [Staphylococcus pettenkoferi]MCY1606053.1 YtxH domain-containing protein [Staphylococcus pettenkoferi]MDH9615458.1 YtxH domain-containing protein [Staphylococcus pettenkoferi]